MKTLVDSGRRVIAVDLPGFGETRGRRGLPEEQKIKWMMQFMEHLKVSVCAQGAGDCKTVKCGGCSPQQMMQEPQRGGVGGCQ